MLVKLTGCNLLVFEAHSDGPSAAGAGENSLQREARQHNCRVDVDIQQKIEPEGAVALNAKLKR